MLLTSYHLAFHYYDGISSLYHIIKTDIVHGCIIDDRQSLIEGMSVHFTIAIVLYIHCIYDEY
jgi:hypothetical protein